MGKEQVDIFGDSKDINFAEFTKIHPIQLDFLKNIQKFFDINQMNQNLKAELNLGIIKWDRYKRRIDIIQAGKENQTDMYSESDRLKTNFRTYHTKSKFDFNDFIQ